MNRTPPHGPTSCVCIRSDYVARVRDGGLTREEQRRIGFPWSPQLVERTTPLGGRTMDASRAALQDGFAANLAGGTHHAFRDRGEGYCILNDVAVAATTMHETVMSGRWSSSTRRAPGQRHGGYLYDDPRVFTCLIARRRQLPVP